MYLVNLHIVSSEVASEAGRLHLVEDVKMLVGGVNVGITGEPILEFDEMQSQKGYNLSSIVS